MSDTEWRPPSQPLPGWYEDPWSIAAWRWFDGHQWTGYVSNAADRPTAKTPKSLASVGAPLVLFFSVASLAVQVHHDRVETVADAAVSLMLTGPFVGIVLLIAPIAILANQVRSWAWIAAGEVLMAPAIVGVLALVEVEGRKHSTAGIGLIYIPMVCSALAVAASIGARFVVRRR